MLESYGQDRAPVYDDRGRSRPVQPCPQGLPGGRAGDIRNVYSAGFLVPDLVVNDIKTVLSDHARD